MKLIAASMEPENTKKEHHENSEKAKKFSI
jgi:hypothetical protein